MADLTLQKRQGRASVRMERALLALGILALLAAPFFVYPIFLMKMLCFALFACAFNLLLGYTGLLSFGHATFYGAAAYFCAYAVKDWGWPPEAGILLGTAGAAVLGLVMLVTLKLQLCARASDGNIATRIATIAARSIWPGIVIGTPHS